MQLLKDKNILLCVSGGIAIYKSLELLRMYVKNGANVQVLMSESAKKFVTSLTFEALSQNKVLHVSTENWADEYNHIKITKNKHIVVLAPATANTINSLTFGIANNLLCQTLLANTKPLLIAPSMNTNMYKHQATQNSLEILQQRGVSIVSPQSKLLACMDEGIGAMAEVLDIYFYTCKMLLKDEFWTNKNVLITGGGTSQKIDDVRFIGNFSSGKMAKSLAYAFYFSGANTTLLTSINEQNLPFKSINYTTSEELKNSIEKQNFEYLYMASAVSDFVPLHVSKGKLKKDDLGEIWDLKLKKNEDILQNIPKKGKKIIGFKAEFDKQNAHKNAKNMLKNKNLDAVCLNILGEEINFGTNESKMSFLTKNFTKELSLKPKQQIAFEIVNSSKDL